MYIAKHNIGLYSLYPLKHIVNVILCRRRLIAETMNTRMYKYVIFIFIFLNDVVL